MFLDKDFWLIIICFLSGWAGIGITAELLWSFYWATLRDVYPILPMISKSLFIKNLLRASVAGPLDVLIVWFYINSVRKSVRKDSDDQGGRLIYRDLIPDPPPTPKNTKPTLH